MGKRANGDGSIKKLPSGSWRGQIMDGFREDGKKNVLSFTAPTKAEVKEKIRKYLSDKEAGVVLRSTKTPFDTWADAWYADYRTQVQPSTYSNYQFTLKTLKDYFGKRPIEEIRLMDINAFLSWLHGKGFSLSKISKCKAMLIQIFSYAEDNNKIPKNPALKAKVIRDLSETEESRKDAFTLEEVRLLWKELPDTLLGNSIRVLLISGLRVQELLALTPEDIAEDGSWIRVNKAVKMVDGVPVLGPPKSRKSRRIIPIPEDYRACVRAIRAQGGKAFLWCSRRSDLLYSVKPFRTKYYRALAAIPGVRRLSPHCCRHTYITRLEAQGVPLQLIARLAGHTNTETTIGYTHTELATLEQAVAALNHTTKA